MASSKIKGITVEIGGDTSKLGKALEDSEKRSKSLQGELNQINKYLKNVDPSNMEMLAQKQEVLTRAIQASSDKLRTLREAQEQVKRQFQNGEIDEGQYRAFQRELIKTESELQNAENELRDLGRSAEDAGQSVEQGSKSVGVMTVALGNLVANGISRAIEGLKNFAGESMQVGMDFEASMSEVSAISGATGDDFELLKKTAEEFGKTTVFSASESAQALKYMSLAGWTAQESADGLGGVLNLASASGMDLAKASDMVTDYLSAFGMEAKDSAYFADMLAFAQANSNTSAEQLAEAYRNCGATLNASGQDVETVTALLAQMANQGYKGSEAGTALTAIMRDMTAKMKDGAIKVGETSIAVQDANGNYRDMTDILKDVESATNGIGDAERATALATTFTADSTKGLNLLLNAGIGTAGEFEEALRGAGGTAKTMGEIMNDNASGDIKAMQSALEGVQIALYEELMPTIREIVQYITTNVIPVIMDTVIPGVSAFIDFIKSHGSEIIAIITGIGAGFLTWNVITMIQGVIGAIKAFTLANEGATIAQKLFNLALGANPIVKVVSLVAMLVTALITFIATNEDALEKLVAVWNTVKDMVGGVVQALVGFFTKTVPDSITNLKNFVTTNVPLIVSSIVTFFSQLPGKIWTAIVGAIANVEKWLSQMTSKATTGIKNVYDAVINGVKNLPSKMLSIGSDAVKGIWEGITGMRDWLFDKVAGFASGIANCIADALDINSPSRVMEKLVGENIVNGIVKGVDNEKKNAERSALDLAGIYSGMSGTAQLNGLNLERNISESYSRSNSGASLIDIMNTLKDYGERLIEASNKSIVLDSGVLVGETIGQIDAKLARNYTLRARRV